ncbi:hypothetical protein TNCV_139561 [Trichonephila clavipes]|uniref:Uncharacterized protein n=1 Tax=Trichonephila clavipes TaxID=2585209 RepID=A0A8X6RPW1_TRICX|nr:hypothetical protein TNCV_139561 [Trichonephila clavipes]
MSQPQGFNDSNNPSDQYGSFQKSLPSGDIENSEMPKFRYRNALRWLSLLVATPDHLLFCAGLEREDIYSSPLLVYDFLRTLVLMDWSSLRLDRRN